MSEDYPLFVRDSRGRMWGSGTRDWALSLAEADADHIADVQGKPATVVDIRNRKVCYHTETGRTEYGEGLCA